MAIATWNLNGAPHAGSSTPSQQAAAWEWLDAVNDEAIVVALLQEVIHSAIPTWVDSRWTLVRGEVGVCGKTAGWGSVIAVRSGSGVHLRPSPQLLDDPVLCWLYDYVVTATVDLPGGDELLIASVHAPARPVAQVTYMGPCPVQDQELDVLGRNGHPAYMNDLAWYALQRATSDGRFIIGGDWNTCRAYDDHPAFQPPAGGLFFERAKRGGWVTVSGDQEVATFWKGTHGYQLDHLFVDAGTAHSGFAVEVPSPGPDYPAEVSDHAPLIWRTSLTSGAT